MILVIASETLQLLPQRAIFWPRERMLIVADIHFGKAAAFRAQGVPVPHGTTAQNLATLDVLLGLHDVAQIVFLGDFLHAKSARAPRTLTAMQVWRERHAALRMTLVRGNHDVHAGDPPAAMRLQVVSEPYRIGVFSFCHHPDALPDTYVLAGHVHPVFRLTGRGDAVRLPCFLVGPRRAILPSFGAFTGGHAITPAAGEQVFVAADDVVVAVPR